MALLDIEELAGITVVRMRRGRVNALDIELLAELIAAMRDTDPRRATVLTGSDTVFCAGADLHRIIDGGPPYVERFLSALTEMSLAVFDRPGPTVAAVNGHAIAGGCVLAAACDVRIMAGGTIGLSELRVGVPFPSAAAEILRHVVGADLDRLVLGARLLDAPRALTVGLIDQVVRPDDLLDVAVGEARRLARIPAEVFSFNKRQLHAPVHERLAACADDDQEVRRLWSSPSTRNAMSAYLGALAEQ
jgi:enoyl-CoA hydratase